MPLPRASLVIPITGLPRALEARAAVHDVRVRENYKRNGDWVWRDWKGYKASVASGELRIEGLPGALVQATLLVPGFVAGLNEPVLLQDRLETRAPPIELTSGSMIRLRVEAPEGVPLPAQVGFDVWRVSDHTLILFTSQEELEKGVWVLSGLPAGSFQVRADAGSGFQCEPIPVTVGEAAPAETTLRLVPRRE